jgi:hypothetical protein
MAELQWLDSYSGQSTEEMIALYGKFRTDSLVVAFEQAVDQKLYQKGIQGLTECEYIILVIEALEREVNNGGYSQFFLNVPFYVPLVTIALEAIGRQDVAMLTQEAIAALGVPDPITGDEIEAIMAREDSEREEKLEECDQRYYTTVGDLAESLFAFIKANQDEISLTD